MADRLMTGSLTRLDIKWFRLASDIPLTGSRSVIRSGYLLRASLIARGEMMVTDAWLAFLFTSTPNPGRDAIETSSRSSRYLRGTIGSA